jgi:hypothetical protein
MIRDRKRELVETKTIQECGHLEQVLGVDNCPLGIASYDGGKTHRQLSSVRCSRWFDPSIGSIADIIRLFHRHT